MRYAPLLLLLVCPVAWAEFRSERDFEKGKEDAFDRSIDFKVKAVLDDDRLLVVGTRHGTGIIDPRTKRVIGGGISDAVKPFVLRRSADGVVDGQEILLRGRYRVVGTEKARGKTVWTLEPAGKD